MTITLTDGPYWTFLVVAASGRSLLVQSDWEFPGMAGAFGWIACACGETDGTVACSHRTVSQMIWDAYDFLDNHVGATVDDPGYF